MAEVKMEREYPNNANFSSTPAVKKEEEVEKKTINGTARTRKKSVWKKIAETFLPGDMASMKDHLLNDILIPSAIETLSDLGHNIVDGMIYGEDAPKRNLKKRFVENASYNYGKVGRTAAGGRSHMTTARTMSPRGRRNMDFDEVLFDDRGDAELALEDLRERIERYHEASVADLYYSAKLAYDFTEEHWGWYDIPRDVRPRPTRTPEGMKYYLPLPRPEYLE